MLLLPLRFYRYALKKDPRKYNIAKSDSALITMVLTPIIIMLVTNIIYVIFQVGIFATLNIFWVPFIICNVFLLGQARHEEKLQKIQRDEEKLKEKLKQMREECERERIFRDSLFSRVKSADNSVDKNKRNAIKLLGIEDSFTKDDVKKAYRRLARKHHPDAGGTEENFKRLNKAYQYLINSI